VQHIKDSKKSGTEHDYYVLIGLTVLAGVTLLFRMIDISSLKCSLPGAKITLLEVRISLISTGISIVSAFYFTISCTGLPSMWGTKVDGFEKSE
jgi:hypothetical protein